jgi:hypothetical protein
MILLISLGFAKISQPLKILLINFRIKNSLLKYSVPILVLFLIVFFVIQEAIISKAGSYIENSDGTAEVANIIFLLIFTLIISKDRFQLLIALLPLVLAVYILGGMRVNMIGVTVFFYLMLSERSLTHPLSLILLLYFSLKSVPFVKNILLYGDGFV